MKLLSMIDLLDNALKKGYAVPAINVSNMETINGLFEIAEATKSPVILQIAPIQFAKQKISPEYMVELIRLSEKKYDVKYAIHLDHGEDINEIKSCVDAGFTSVMYDGSALDYERNIEITKIAREIAGDKVTLEGELGALVGKEGSAEEDNSIVAYTNPNEALEFVNRSKVDCLAVSIGNSHGYYKGDPKLNFNILKEIYENINIPVVLHGASGLSPKDINSGIKNGIAKINFFTSVDGAFTNGITQTLESNSRTYMMEYMEKARQSMMKEIHKIIKMCGSENKA